VPTSDYVREALAERTGEVVLHLLTLNHPNMAAPLRVTDDTVQTVSRGDTFIAFPFDLQLVKNSNDAPPIGRLTISNVDRQIVLALRSLPLEPPLSVLIEIVLASAPNTVEASLVGFELRGANYDAQRVSGDLVLDVLDREPYPAIKYLPSNFPGVF
jgi:hypothetical protein